MWHRILSAWVSTLAGTGLAMAADALPSRLPVPVPTEPAPCLSPEADAAILAEAPPAGPRVWAEADYLLWFERRQGVPLLVGSVPDAMVNTPGGLTGPATPLYPTNGRIDFGAINGVGGRVGGQLSERLGLDIGGFVLERSSLERSFRSPGSPSLVRTYIQPSRGLVQNLLSAKIDPNGYPGSVRVDADTRLWGLDGNVRLPWYRFLADRNDLLLGFRYLNLREGLSINDRADLAGGQVANTVSDNFRTQNHIYVAQVGMQSYWSGRRWGLEYFAKLGVGGASQRVEIFGNNTLTGLPDENTGLYTQRTNIGTFERDKTVAVGEIGFKLGYRITERVNIHAGYNILYVSSVVRPGAALDRVVNDSNIRFVADPPADPISRRPEFDFHRASTDFFAQGLVAGLSFQY